ncbi:hypothetical protein [Pseudoalteromonas piscicida]|uniref:hypothetical protein n=1 Tax=Pseudoalteromonas piscicida TaxID=43662 RepID=UPI0005FA16F2|nr:hypothetical protein [Pseudoalteromonas piscicida]KJY97467.1 hypothetical protein TW73_15660 [Pseudoalteromonas piscicida]
MDKVILKNTGESLSAALSVQRLFTQRKVGKGDPVKYLRGINWQDLGKQSATEVKNIIKGMQATVKRLDDVNTTPEKHNFSADKPPPTTLSGLWFEESV